MPNFQRWIGPWKVWRARNIGLRFYETTFGVPAIAVIDIKETS